MTVNVAINGFGRIGRNILRAIIESGRNDLKVVAINDLAPVDTSVHLLKYDSVHGRFPKTVNIVDENMDLGFGPIKMSSERDFSNLKWKDKGVDIVMECTGVFTSREGANGHIKAGAKKVLISAPASDVDITVVYGVNHQKLESNHTIVSNASCTTNCLAPVAKVLNKVVGIENGFMTTVHSFTGDQTVLDTVHGDLYRTRSASQNMIPTSTGAAKAVGLVLPELDGKLNGIAVRVPTANVSMIDLTFNSLKDTTSDEINEAIREASESSDLKGVLAYTDEKLVSSDFNHNPHSSIFHTDQTKVTGKRLVRVLSWYDNEWGFSNRMADTAIAMGKNL